MPIAQRMLPVREESLRDQEPQIVPGACHRDVEEAALLFEFMRFSGAEIRGDAAVDHIQHEDRFPFLALG